ncbi:MAG: FtsX-like permease family protein, partial [Gemmatimonadetes bacterium]|nr:FtsX-like permease family protein [Gemmatimonadota bacterium]
MALGIGANAAILSVVDATRLRPLPFDDAASLMEVWLEPVEPADPIRGELTGADLGDLRAEPGLFAALAGWRATTVSYVGLSSQEVLKGAEITAGMFSGVLRVQPFLGRTFLPEEDRAGATPAVLLSHAFWSEHFGGDPKTIGRSVVLDGTPHVVVGVMPPGLRTPFRPGAEVWTPARLEPRRCRSGCTTVSGVGRLASGTRLEVARDRALALGQRLAESYPETNRGVAPVLGPLRDPSIRMSARTTRLLLSTGAVVLLLACSNVALLLLARGVDRSREMGVRRSVGASRGDLVAQLLAESVGLALTGALLGVGVAVWVLEAIERSVPPALLGSITFGLDLGVMAWVALLTVGAGLFFGMGPAAVGAGTHDPLGRSPATTRVGATRAAGIVRGGVGALQVALATVLVVGAGGLVRSLQEATGEALGFDPGGVLSAQVELGSPSAFGTARDQIEKVAVVTERLEGVPGVFSVGAAASLPFEETTAPAEVLIRNDSDSHQTLSETVLIRAVSPSYFYTMRQRLSDGRWFRAEDDETSAPVAIVSATAARRLFADPPRSPLGSEIALGIDVPLGEEVYLGGEAR